MSPDGAAWKAVGAAWKVVVAVALTATAAVVAKKPLGTHPTYAKHSSSDDTLLPSSPSRKSTGYTTRYSLGTSGGPM